MVDMVLALAESDCEQLRPGWLAQPANAASSLAYVAVGVWLLWRSRRPGVDRRALVVGGGAMVGVGVGSLAYHGPQPAWAGPVHDGAVAWLALVLVTQNLRLVARPAGGRIAVTAWASAAPCLALALAAYVAGRAGSALCHPAALWQPHAAWHALSAVGLGLAMLGCSRSHARATRAAARWAR
jgi:hypothetical protein